MKKLRTAVCILIITACLPGILHAARLLPLENDDLVAKKYAGWSGVLRIWAFEGWTGGELASGWIARCAAAFEKSHPGVYIEVTYPGAEAVARLSRPGVRAPDLILFPPGLLTSVSGLSPTGELPVRGSLLGAGQGFAAPVALGGYAWAVNESAEGARVPTDEPHRSWSAAAARLGEPDAPIEEIDIAPPGIDLGLPASAEVNPIESFIAGKLGAVCVTQREIARLNRLADQGRGPEWTLRPGAAAWTDQVLYIAVVANGGETEQLSAELLRHLLGEESQKQLAKSNLLGVLDAPSGFSPGSAMETLDRSLHREDLDAAPAFAIRPQ